MDFLNVLNFDNYDGTPLVTNATVYGLNDSIRRAKLPMLADSSKATEELTPGIASLAQSIPGSGHDQWLTGVIVQFDLTFTVKAWTEAERYTFINFISSQSTMHRLAKFDLDTAYSPYVDERMIVIMKSLVNEYNQCEDPEQKKELYLRMLYSNPAGFKLTAGMTTNYRQLKTIYRQRKNHRLPEWRYFCKWIETLPLARELIIPKEEGNKQ